MKRAKEAESLSGQFNPRLLHQPLKTFLNTYVGNIKLISWIQKFNIFCRRK